MSMVALAISNLNPAAMPGALPRGVDWITPETAAERLKLSYRRIIQLCQSKWMPQGLARREVRDRGWSSWRIRSDADPALARYVLPADVPVELAGLTEAQRAKWKANEALLHEWMERCRAAVRAQVPNDQRRTKAQVTEAFVTEKRALGISISARTLHRWYRQSRSDEGRAGLMDGRWDRKGKTPVEDPFLAEVRRLYCSRERLALAYCWRLACQKALEQGWKVIARRTAAKYIATIPLAERVFTREGAKAYTDKCEPYVECDYSTLAANEAWNSDHHKLDIWVKIGTDVNRDTGEETPRYARPWITVWQDMRSRKVVGWHLFAGEPCTDTIILAFKHACASHGLPDRVFTDNGRDFLSYALQGRTRKERFRKQREAQTERLGGIFRRMGVESHAVQPYHGQSKPLERCFRTLEAQCVQLWPTWCGNSPATRPEGLQKRLDGCQAPTLEELREAVGTWIEGLYNAAPHFGDGMNGKTPNQVFAETLLSKRTLPADVIDVLCLKPGKPTKVLQNGVTWHKLRYGQHSDGLRRHMGRTVLVCGDPKDISRVIVQELDGRYICAAEVNQRIPRNATSEMLSQALARKRRARKIDLAFRELRPAIHETPAEIMFRLAAENQRRQGRNPMPEPETIRVVPPENPESIAQIQRAMKREPLRQAAGAECIDLLAFANANFDAPVRNQGDAFSLLEALSQGMKGGSNHG